MTENYKKLNCRQTKKIQECQKTTKHKNYRKLQKKIKNTCKLQDTNCQKTKKYNNASKHRLKNRHKVQENYNTSG